MLPITYLMALFFIADAGVVEYSENLLDGPLSEVTFITSQEAKRVIEVDYETAARDNLSGERRGVKDGPEASGSVQRIRYPGEPHAPASLDTPPRARRGNVTAERRSRAPDATPAPGGDSRIYFASDDEKGAGGGSTVAKPPSSDDGKIYFEPMLPKKNSTKGVEEMTTPPGDGNIVKTERSNGTAEAALSDRGVTIDSLDNRDAFNAVGSCKGGDSRVRGKCVPTE